MMVPTPPTTTPSPSGSGSSSGSSSSSTPHLQVLSYNVHSCVGIDNVYSPQRIVDVLASAAATATTAAGAAASASASASASATSASTDTFTVVALQEIESNGARARQRRCGADNYGHENGGDGVNGGNDDDELRRPIRTRIWSAPHADDQPQFIADGLAAASSSGRGSCDRYHVSFAPAISSVAGDRRHERHGDPDDDRHGVAEMGKFGIAILSQLPIVETRIHRYQRYKKKTLRNAQACLILLPPSSSSSLHGAKKQQSASKRAIWVVNTHLGCHSGGEQHEQAMELVVFLRSLSQPPSSNTVHRSTNTAPKADIVPLPQIILCGDFNSPPFFRSMEVIRRAGFVDASSRMM